MSESNVKYPLRTLFDRAQAALEVYSNVHRGNGHFSLASTALYEHARSAVFLHFKVSPRQNIAIFCSPSRLERIIAHLPQGSYQWVCSGDLGLAMGVCALVVEKKVLPKDVPAETGGGVVQFVTENKVLWHHGAERFEVGTPPIFPAIMLGIAMEMIREAGNPDLFQQREPICDLADILSSDEFSDRNSEALLSALSASLMGHDVMVPTANGSVRYVNLDGAASTPSFRPIWTAFQQTLTQPATAHAGLIDQSEDIVRAFFHAPSEAYDFLFACNASEAINFAARNLAAETFGAIEPVVVNSLLDHHSNELPWRFQTGLHLERAAVDADGFYDLTALETMLTAYNQEEEFDSKRIILVTINGASNVLGTFNDLPALTALCHRYGARIFVDGAQLSAHHAVDLLATGIDYYAFSAHKIYSPFGSGGLFLRKGLLNLDEDLCHSGIANTAGVVALAKSLDLLMRIGMKRVAVYELALTTAAVEGLKKLDQVHIFGMTDAADPKFISKGPVVTFEFKHIPHNLASLYLAEWGGIGNRTGCFCVHMMLVRMMHIRRWRTNLAKFLLRFKLKEVLPILPGMLRISFGIENTQEDVVRFLATMDQLQAHKESKLNQWLASVHEGTWLLPRGATSRAIQVFVAERLRMVFPHGSRD